MKKEPIYSKSDGTKVAMEGTMQYVNRWTLNTPVCYPENNFQQLQIFPRKSSHQTAFPYFRNEEGSFFDVFSSYRRLSPTMPNLLFYKGKISQRPRDICSQRERPWPLPHFMFGGSAMSKH